MLHASCCLLSCVGVLVFEGRSGGAQELGAPKLRPCGYPCTVMDLAPPRGVEASKQLGSLSESTPASSALATEGTESPISVLGVDADGAAPGLLNYAGGWLQRYLLMISCSLQNACLPPCRSRWLGDMRGVPGTCPESGECPCRRPHRVCPRRPQRPPALPARARSLGTVFLRWEGRLLGGPAAPTETST